MKIESFIVFILLNMIAGFGLAMIWHLWCVRKVIRKTGKMITDIKDEDLGSPEADTELKKIDGRLQVTHELLDLIHKKK